MYQISSTSNHLLLFVPSFKWHDSLTKIVAMTSHRSGDASHMCWHISKHDGGNVGHAGCHCYILGFSTLYQLRGYKVIWAIVFKQMPETIVLSEMLVIPV